MAALSRRWLARAVVVALPVIFCLLILELGVRLFCTSDEDGNLKFRDSRLKPYHAPARKAERVIAQYLASEDSAIIHDPELGWTLRPNVAHHNSAGFISSDSAVALEPSPGRLRIAAFGGSYTQGTFDKGWWRVLEDELNRSGVLAEVLNFGVDGYGMDQAYLRWKRDGAPWHPQIVIFGFAVVNCYDNLNLIRMIKDPETDIPFTKPRFVMEGDGLALLNSPTPRPAEMPAIIANPAAWGPSAFDYYWVSQDFRYTWWRHSRLAAFAETKLSERSRLNSPENFYRIGEEPAQLALRIVETFQAGVKGSGSSFIVAHLPYDTELEALKEKGRFPHEELYAALKSRVTVVSPEQAMLAACGGKVRAFFLDGHYIPEFQTVVGKEIAEFIRTHQESRPTVPTR